MVAHFSDRSRDARELDLPTSSPARCFDLGAAVAEFCSRTSLDPNLDPSK
jgi:hypothetical protein